MISSLYMWKGEKTFSYNPLLFRWSIFGVPCPEREGHIAVGLDRTQLEELYRTKG